MNSTMEPVRLYRVHEVTEPGIIPAGRYLFVQDSAVVLEIELQEPIHPLDLKPLIRRALAA